MPKEGNEWWNTFLKCGEGYGYRVKKDGRKMYWIDEDIVTALKACDINRMSATDTINAITALKACDINRMSATDTINAILRSFIILNKQELRECIKQHDSLI